MPNAKMDPEATDAFRPDPARASRYGDAGEKTQFAERTERMDFSFLRAPALETASPPLSTVLACPTLTFRQVCER
jgi:hypothetical protein